MKQFKMINGWVLAFVVASLIMVWGCNSGQTPEEMLATSWKLKTLNVKNQPPPPPSIMAEASFNFHKDGRYEIMLGSLERGKWSLSEDKKELITIPDGKQVEQRIDIVSLTVNELRLTNNAGGSPVEMVLERQQ